jgi:hypothetical protein
VARVAISVNMSWTTVAPQNLTVFTEIWTMSGDRDCSAARMTPSMVMSSTVLKAATPYRF